MLKKKGVGGRKTSVVGTGDLGARTSNEARDVKIRAAQVGPDAHVRQVTLADLLFKDHHVKDGLREEAGRRVAS